MNGQPSDNAGATPDPFRMLRRVSGPRGPAPVHLWDPPFCGDIDLRIGRDGVWHHEGRPIRRQAMINLFASILKREGEEYFLVNPVEKVRIQVDDCPFLVVDMEIRDPGREQVIVFFTNVEESVEVDPDHPLCVTGAGEPRPTVHVRGGMDGLLSRSVFYRLVAAARQYPQDGELVTGVDSKGCFFELGRTALESG